MDSKQIRGIADAYRKVYSLQEDVEQLEENPIGNMVNAVKNKLNTARETTGVKAPGSGKVVPFGGKARENALKKAIGEDVEVVDNEEEIVEIYNSIIEYLMDEGYAETEESAGTIIENMSDEWLDNLIEGSYEERIAKNNANYDKARKRAAQRAAARNDARKQGKTGSVPGVGYVSPRKEKETYTDSKGKERHGKGL